MSIINIFERRVIELAREQMATLNNHELLVPLLLIEVGAEFEAGTLLQDYVCAALVVGGWEPTRRINVWRPGQKQNLVEPAQ